MLPADDWHAIRAFVTSVVAQASPRVAYPRDALLSAITYHVFWAHRVAGLELDVDEVFRREVIGHAVAVMPTSSPSTMGRTRSLLLRVGEALGVIAVPPALPPLAAADASAPYSASEVEDLRTWAYLQGDDRYRHSAQALLALGLGAGLPTRDLARVRAMDVVAGCERLRVEAGDFPRTVRVRPEWVGDLSEVLDRTDDPADTLFRPGVAFHKNMVLSFLHRSMGGNGRPSTQRMRVTWLVSKLVEGTPMHELLNEAGLKSMDALVRYERFFPLSAHAASQGSRAGSADLPGLPRPG